jgi:hypothetical protein
MDTKIIITNSQGEEFSVAIGFDLLASMVGSMPDQKNMAELCDFLSVHESAEVRDAIASKEFLSETTLVRLSEDTNPTVKASLVRSESFREWVDSETLIEMCRSNSALAREIASSVGSFTNADTDALVKELAAHSDPAVRMEIASGWGLSKFSIRSLSKDSDPSVASTAQRTLENR